MTSAPRTSQVVIEQPAPLNECQNCASPQDGQHKHKLLQDCRRGREAVFLEMKNAPGNQVAKKSQGKHEENGKDEEHQHRPSSAQSLAAGKNPAQPAIYRFRAGTSLEFLAGAEVLNVDRPPRSFTPRRCSIGGG